MAGLENQYALPHDFSNLGAWDRAWEQGKYVIGHFKLDDDQLAELFWSRQA
jgi:hypothetical protein